MKKIVVLNDFPIIPPDHGGKLRIYNIYSQLSSKYKVNYICFGNHKKIIETKINESFSEIRIPKGEIHKITEKILGKLLGVSLDDIIAMAFCKSNANLKTIIQKYLNNCDIVIL